MLIYKSTCCSVLLDRAIEGRSFGFRALPDGGRGGGGVGGELADAVLVREPGDGQVGGGRGGEAEQALQGRGRAGPQGAQGEEEGPRGGRRGGVAVGGA